jgi:hypothetical protein
MLDVLGDDVAGNSDDLSANSTPDGVRLRPVLPHISAAGNVGKVIDLVLKLCPASRTRTLLSPSLEVLRRFDDLHGTKVQHPETLYKERRQSTREERLP